MSTRIGPYEVDVDGSTWTWEHDMYQRDLLADDNEPGVTFRIWAPHALAIEVARSSWPSVRAFLPAAVVASIEERML